MNPLLLLIFALCADTFTACFLYGAGHVRIPVLSSAAIILLSAGSLALFQIAGTLLRPWLAYDLPVFLSSCVLILLGAMRFNSGSAEAAALHANRIHPEYLSFSEACFLGISLSADNAAAGLGAGLSRDSLAALTLLSLSVSFLSVVGGCHLGRVAAKRIPIDVSKLGGMILIVLGLVKLI